MGCTTLGREGLTLGDEGRKVQEQLSGTGRRGVGLNSPVGGGGGGILTEPILVVNQKAKLIELNNQYSVYDQHGTKVASVNQVGQTAAKKVLRLVASVDQFMTHHLEISDASGAVVLKLTRPRKFLKSTVIVSDGADREIGRIVQQNAIGKITATPRAGRRIFVTEASPPVARNPPTITANSAPNATTVFRPTPPMNDPTWRSRSSSQTGQMRST